MRECKGAHLEDSRSRPATSSQERSSARLLFFRIVTLPNYQYNITRKGTGSTLSLFADKSSRRQC